MASPFFDRRPCSLKEDSARQIPDNQRYVNMSLGKNRWVHVGKWLIVRRFGCRARGAGGEREGGGVVKINI